MSSEIENQGGYLAQRLRERMAMATHNRQARKALDPALPASLAPHPDEAATSADGDPTADAEVVTVEAAAVDVAVTFCTQCETETVADYTCHRCDTPLCLAHSYAEAESVYHYCRACADHLVGVCAICDALQARPCRTCGMKVCDDHARRIIERWGWGGAPGQGGVTDWFPVLRTYCHDHSHDRVNAHKPNRKTFAGFDATSPEW